MWIMTTTGFYSVVAYDAATDGTIGSIGTEGYEPHADPAETDEVLVRTRSEADMTYLCEQISGQTFKVTPHADYMYRAVVSKDAWAKFLAEETEAIDYANFKHRVTQTQGRARENLYLRVWSVLRGIEG